MYKIIIVAAIALFSSAFAQMPERTQQQQALDMAIIEEAISRASPTCRTSLEMAMQSETEISDECKEEFQAITMEMRREFESGRGAPGKEAPKRESWIHPGVAVAIFVGVAFAAVAGYVVHVNGQLAEKERSKPSSRKIKTEAKRK